MSMQIQTATRLQRDACFRAKSKQAINYTLLNRFAEVEVKAVAIDMGSFREEVAEVSAGNLASLTLSGQGCSRARRWLTWNT